MLTFYVSNANVGLISPHCFLEVVWGWRQKITKNKLSSQYPYKWCLCSLELLVFFAQKTMTRAITICGLPVIENCDNMELHTIPSHNISDPFIPAMWSYVTCIYTLRQHAAPGQPVQISQALFIKLYWKAESSRFFKNAQLTSNLQWKRDNREGEKRPCCPGKDRSAYPHRDYPTMQTHTACTLPFTWVGLLRFDCHLSFQKLDSGRGFPTVNGMLCLLCNFGFVNRFRPDC